MSKIDPEILAENLSYSPYLVKYSVGEVYFEEQFLCSTNGLNYQTLRSFENLLNGAYRLGLSKGMLLSEENN